MGKVEKIPLVGQKAPVDEAIQREFEGMSSETIEDVLACEAEFAQTEEQQLAFAQRYLAVAGFCFDRQEKTAGVKECLYQASSRVLSDACANPEIDKFLSGEMSETERVLFLALYPELEEVRQFTEQACNSVVNQNE